MVFPFVFSRLRVDKFKYFEKIHLKIWRTNNYCMPSLVSNVDSISNSFWNKYYVSRLTCYHFFI